MPQLILFSISKKIVVYSIARFYGFPKLYLRTQRSIHQYFPNFIQAKALKIARFAFTGPLIVHRNIHHKCKNAWCESQYCHVPLDPEAYIHLKKAGLKCPLPITRHPNGDLTVPRCVFLPAPQYKSLRPWFGDHYKHSKDHYDSVKRAMLQASALRKVKIEPPLPKDSASSTPPSSTTDLRRTFSSKASKITKISHIQTVLDRILNYWKGSY